MKRRTQRSSVSFDPGFLHREDLLESSKSSIRFVFAGGAGGSAWSRASNSVRMNTGKISRDFVPFIHILRGLAPLLVIWSHLVGYFLYESKTSWEPYLYFHDEIASPLHLYHAGGHLGVVVFFLISGFIISQVVENETRFEFTIKRLFRLFPALLVAGIVAWLLTSASSVLGYGLTVGSPAEGISEYLLSATLIDHFVLQNNRVMTVTWTLATEVTFYAIVAMILPMIRLRPVAATWLMLAISALVIAPARFSPWVAYSSTFAVYLPLFMIGRLAYLRRSCQIATSDFWILLAASLVTFLALHEYALPGLLMAGSIKKIVTYPTAILIFFGALMLQPRKMPFPLKFFGDISYSLYLLHVPIGMFALALLHRTIGYGPALIVAVSASILGAYLSTRFVERPAQRMGRQWLGRPASRNQEVTVGPLS